MLEELKSIKAWGVVLPDSKSARNPLNTDIPLSCNEPETWHTFEACMEAVEDGLASYVCFCFSHNDPFCFIDLDDINGVWTHEKVLQHVEFFNTYTELSRSGNGIHIIGYAKKKEKAWCKRNGYEVYDSGHWLTLTFQAFDGYTELNNIQAQTAKLIDKFDNKPTRAIKKGKCKLNIGQVLRCLRNENKTSELMDGFDASVGEDESRGDFNLMLRIGFYTNYDPDKMEEVFGLTQRANRGKWRERKDYRERTINNVLSMQN